MYLTQFLTFYLVGALIALFVVGTVFFIYFSHYKKENQTNITIKSKRKSDQQEED